MILVSIGVKIVAEHHGAFWFKSPTIKSTRRLALHKLQLFHSADREDIPTATARLRLSKATEKANLQKLIVRIGTMD